MVKDPLYINFDAWCIDLVDRLEELMPELYPKYDIIPSTDIISSSYKAGEMVGEFAERIKDCLQPAAKAVKALRPYIESFPDGMQYAIESAIIKWAVAKII